jgi:MtN3 and saliva related transmembrane protein
MHFEEFMGLLGGFLTTVSMGPQVWRLFRLRCADEISLTFSACFTLGILFWLLYGIYLELAPIILWNAIALVLSLLMLYAKLKWGFHGRLD